MRQPKHIHRFFRKEWIELHDKHLVLRRRIECRCHFVRESLAKIISLNSIVDKRTKREKKD